MPSAYRSRPRILLLKAKAWAAAEELAEAAGVTPSAFVEFMLLDCWERAETEPEPEPEGQPGVIPISRARRRRRW